MEKPSEKAVSNLKVEDVTYIYWDRWRVELSWYYDSADPAEYLVVCREDGSDTVYKIESGNLTAFKNYSLTDTCMSPGKYTYTVYTVGNGYSTSASKSVTVNCEYPSYSSGGGSGSSGSLENSTWKGPNGLTFNFAKDGTWELRNTMTNITMFSGTYEKEAGGYQLYWQGQPNVFLKADDNSFQFADYTFTRN